MKCPVCDNVNTSRVCLKCGFDSSRDYGSYPTFGPVRGAPSASGARREWERKQNPPKPVLMPEESRYEPKPPNPPEPTRKKKPWLTIVACAAMLVLGIGVGMGVGKDEMKESAKPWRDNVLCCDRIPGTHNDYIGLYTVFGSEYQRGEIKSVTFLDTLDEMPGDAWDVSEAGTGKVMAWVKPNGTLYDLYIGAEGGIWANRDCGDLFAGYNNASEITFADAFHTENVESMGMMFYDCDSLTNLELSNFDTSNVQDMKYMFTSCEGLTHLELSSFDTSNVLTMRSMFYECDVLPRLDLSSFDTTKVQDMGWMFFGCKSLARLDLSDRFVTSNADTFNMFYDCPAGDDYQYLLN